MVRVAGLGPGAGWTLHPPVSQSEAEAEFEQSIPESAWLEICEAFERHGERLDKLDGTRENRNPNDPRGWHKRKTDAEKAVDSALNALEKINRNFLTEAENNVSLKLSGGLQIYNCQTRLNRAIDEILFLSWVLREAEPLSRDTPSKSESQKILARDIFAALEACGATLSNGWTIGKQRPSHADLTGFERLAELLEIHQGETPAATSKWLRDALAQNK